MHDSWDVRDVLATVFAVFVVAVIIALLWAADSAPTSASEQRAACERSLGSWHAAIAYCEHR